MVLLIYYIERKALLVIIITQEELFWFSDYEMQLSDFKMGGIPENV